MLVAVLDTEALLVVVSVASVVLDMEVFVVPVRDMVVLVVVAFAVQDVGALLVEASAAFVLDKVAFVVERTADAASVASGLVVPILVVQVLTVMP